MSTQRFTVLGSGPLAASVGQAKEVQGLPVGRLADLAGSARLHRSIGLPVRQTDRPKPTRGTECLEETNGAVPISHQTCSKSRKNKKRMRKPTRTVDLELWDRTKVPAKSSVESWFFVFLVQDCCPVSPQYLQHQNVFALSSERRACKVFVRLAATKGWAFLFSSRGEKECVFSHDFPRPFCLFRAVGDMSPSPA